MRIDNDQLEALLEILLEQTGIDLSEYRRTTLSRRVSGRLARLGMNANEYLAVCRDDPDECREVVSSIAINVSSFFRDPVVYEAIAQSVLPRLAEMTNSLRVWSAGCAAGEEAYSIAILIQEELKKTKNTACHPMIFATDIDHDVLTRAEEALYPTNSLNDTKLRIADAYFSRVDDGFELCPAIKHLVHFSANDLLSQNVDAPAESVYGDFNIILCRNVLIYFSESKQVEALERLYRSLATGGYLVLGSSEAMCRELKSRFKTVDARNKIYQK